MSCRQRQPHERIGKGMKALKLDNVATKPSQFSELGTGIDQCHLDGERPTSGECCSLYTEIKQ